MQRCKIDLDHRVEKHDPRLLGDDLLAGEVMLDELRDGGEARPLKAVLTLARGQQGQLLQCKWNQDANEQFGDNFQ